MADLSKINPYGAAAEALSGRSKKADDDDKPKQKMLKPSSDATSDAAEEKDLTSAAQRLKDYRTKKNIGDATPAEVRLFNLQSKRAQSYKKGAKKIGKNAVAKLHKGEMVLGKKSAGKYRSKLKGSSMMLGAGKSKKKATKRG